MESELIILKNFIKEYLPSSVSFRRGEHNHIRYISDTLHLVFLKFYSSHTRLPEDKIVLVFKQLGFLTKENLDELWGRTGPSGIKPQRSIYINVDTESIKALRRATMNLPPNTNSDKAKQIEDLISSLLLFFFKNDLVKQP